jgi:large subunit ribosomal protein L31
MKTEIHPTYTDSNVTCTCGNQFVTRSTTGDIHVEICSACHPFYTGRQKLVDTGGRVERFQRRAAPRPAPPASSLGRTPRPAPDQDFEPPGHVPGGSFFCPRVIVGTQT